MKRVLMQQLIYAKKAEDSVDVFHAFVQHTCFWRRITQTERGQESGLMTGKDHLLVKNAEDARMFEHQGSIWGILIHHLPGENTWGHLLYNHAEGSTVPIKLPEGLKQGKNWQPFSLGEEGIGIVYSLCPFVLLIVDPATGKANQYERIRHQPFPEVSEHDGYSRFRGGSNALSKYRGAGRLKVTKDVHIPFIWSRTMEEWPMTIEFIDVTGLQRRGLGIIDPVSLWVDKTGMFLSVSCSEEGWHLGQRFESFILQLEE